MYIFIYLSIYEGDKYSYSMKWKIPCLKPDWVFHSVDKGYALPMVSKGTDAQNQNCFLVVRPLRSVGLIKSKKKTGLTTASRDNSQNSEEKDIELSRSAF